MTRQQHDKTDRALRSTLPPHEERPADSDGLPSGQWGRRIERDGYRLLRPGGASAVLPLVLQVLVLAVTLLLAALWWDRIPEVVATRTGLDGRATQWAERSPGTVLVGPLLGAGVSIFTTAVVVLITSVLRPHPGDPHTSGLGPLIRVAATNRRAAAGASWGMLAFTTAVCAISALGWAAGTAQPQATWLLGISLLGLFLLVWRQLRRVPGDVRRELAALELERGPDTAADQHRWRFVMVAEDPDEPLLVRSNATNWTVNIAHRGGRLLAGGFVGVMLLVGLATTLVPLLR